MKTILYSNRLILKVLDDSFAGEVLDFVMRNKDFLNEWEVLRNDKYYTYAFQKQLLIEDLINIEAGRLFKVWLFKADGLEKRIIGSVSISNIVKGAFQSCHLGYRIDEQERNKGYMTEAIERMITYAFQELKLHRIEANIMPKNGASLGRPYPYGTLK
jgi:ribosomal-protein-alanine N-acetyltransferase